MVKYKFFQVLILWVLISTNVGAQVLSAEMISLNRGSVSNIDKKVFTYILNTIQKFLSPIAQQNGETLTVYGSWDDFADPWENAYSRRVDHDVSLIAYGSLARRPELSADSFVLALCHEIGHLYGGEPYLDAYNKIAAEGQADYWAEQVCMPIVLQEMNSGNDSLRERKLKAGLELTTFFANKRHQAPPQYETPDLTEVPQTVVSYPATMQCRLDTYYAGALNLPRPKCWFHGP